MIQRYFLLLYLSYGLVAAACTPTAQSSQSTHVATADRAVETAAAAETQPADPSQELVCRSETVTGTRFKRRYCATQAERDKRQQDDRESGERMQRKGAQVSSPRLIDFPVIPRRGFFDCIQVALAASASCGRRLRTKISTASSIPGVTASPASRCRSTRVSCSLAVATTSRSFAARPVRFRRFTRPARRFVAAAQVERRS